MRLIFILMILLMSFGTAYLYGLPCLAEKKLRSFLQITPNQTLEVENLRANFSGLSIDHIKLDQDGFNTIDNLQISMHWPHQKILSARIGHLQTAHIAGAPTGLVRITREALKAMPKAPVILTKFTTDIATELGDIRLEGNAQISKPNETGEQFLSANVRAQQFQISFDARIDAVLVDQRIKKIDVQITDGRTNLGPFQFARMTGWVSYDESKTPLTLAGQIDMGTGRFHDLALTNINFVIGGTHNAPEILFRAGLSGHPDLSLSSDYSAGPKTIFKTVLTASTLFPVFEALLPDQDIPEALSDLQDITVSLNYMPERRFEGGPYPFELLLKENNTTTLTGTALFYPDTLDVRGSAETKAALAKALVDYFGLDPEGQSGNFLRLDSSLKGWLMPPSK